MVWSSHVLALWTTTAQKSLHQLVNRSPLAFGVAATMEAMAMAAAARAGARRAALVDFAIAESA